MRLGVFPSGGYVDPARDPVGWLTSLALPVATLAAGGIAFVAKQTRDSMSDVLGMEYITMLRARGLSERSIVYKHAQRNAAIPVVTMLGLLLVNLLSGAVVIEGIFSVPGLGQQAVIATGDLVVFAVLGVGLGLVAGYLGGWMDRGIGWLSDLVLALPGIIVLLMVLSVFPGNGHATMVALGVITAPMLLRVTRSVTIVVRQELYVRAARLSGLSGPRIMWRHILPRLSGPIIVQLFLFAATAVLVQAALSFLGLAAPETKGPSWGNMVAQAAQVTSQDIWLAIPTGGILLLTVLALGCWVTRCATVPRSAGLRSSDPPGSRRGRRRSPLRRTGRRNCCRCAD